MDNNSTATAALATATPIEIDTQLAELDSRYLINQRDREALEHHIRREQELPPQYRNEDYLARMAQRLAEAVELQKQLQTELEPLKAEYVRRGGWARFFLVPGGHIHQSTDCSTCNKGRRLTRFGWLPDMSGRTEADVVAEHGALLCTVCFPTAPVEWTNFYEEAAAAKKAARCSGSGTYIDRTQPHRTGYYAGNWATCPECDARPTITGTGKLRAHKPVKH